ncbi:TonB-dependent receptor [Spongiibacter sp. KMU-166]|uniref:TonB-dependent receptor n=1 Tax=Spongiibacter thalassae TaxID=2721624 RepID=A0ABX1GA70_9GAMM|nr:TonB-dependent receptor [Spongiibacter thalassae]NKI16054.1 TonB-dependent receptor [Spongiibacter thalassae]
MHCNHMLMMVSISAVLISSHANAADATPESSPKKRNALIEEVVVTAQKREENLQDVPISIAAYTSEGLAARGATDTKDLATITPALSITEFGGFTFIYIRGVGSDSFIPSADPSVTTYVDGIYVPTSQGLLTSFGGIERVEVLKGPQGTLFGRNSTGGAINVITKTPGNEIEANISGVVGNYHEKRLKGFISAPVTEWLGVSADLLKDTIDHQYTHVSRKIPAEKSRSGRFRLNFHPVDSFEIDLSYFKSEQKGQGTLLTKNTDPSSSLGATIPDEPDNREANSDFPAGLRGTHEVYAASIFLELPWFDTKLIASDQLINTSYTAFDYDGSPQPLVAFVVTPKEFTDAKSLELQALSNEFSWASDKLDWVVGAYYLESEGGFADINIPLTGPSLNTLGISGLLDTVGVDLNSAISPTIIATGLLGTESISGFAQATWHATAELSFTLGGRYQDEKRFLTKGELSYSNDGGEQTDPVEPFPLESDSRDNLITKAAVSYTPIDDLMIYTSYSQGYKSATYNIVNLATPPELVLPEEVEAYELGLKSSLFDRSLKLNASIFRNDIENKQTSIVSLTSGGVIEFYNAKSTRIDGIEADLTGVPFINSNSGFAITANAAYLDANYIKYTNAPGFDEENGLYQNGLDFSGNKVERTPDVSGGLGVSQLINLPHDSELEIAADWYYNSGFYYSAQNSENYREDSYSLLDLRLSYFHIPSDIKLTALVKNALNEDYHIGLFQTDFGINSSLAYETQYSLRLEWNL